MTVEFKNFTANTGRNFVLSQNHERNKTTSILYEVPRRFDVNTISQSGSMLLDSNGETIASPVQTKVITEHSPEWKSYNRHQYPIYNRPQASSRTDIANGKVRNLNADCYRFDYMQMGNRDIMLNINVDNLRNEVEIPNSIKRIATRIGKMLGNKI